MNSKFLFFIFFFFIVSFEPMGSSVTTVTEHHQQVDPLDEELQELSTKKEKITQQIHTIRELERQLESLKNANIR